MKGTLFGLKFVLLRFDFVKKQSRASTILLRKMSIEAPSYILQCKMLEANVNLLRSICYAKFIT